MKRWLVLFVIVAAIQVPAQWVEQNSGLTTALNSVTALNNNYTFACGASGKVISTSDGGTTWKVISDSTIPSTDTLYSVIEVDSVTLVVLGMSSGSGTTNAYFTNNGGSSWSKVLSQTNGFFDVAGFLKPFTNTFLIVSDPVGGRWSLFKSNNFVSWDSTELYLPKVGTEGGFNSSVQYYRDTSNFWFGTDAGHIYHSSNGGVSWESENTPGAGTIQAIHFNSNKYGLAGGIGLSKSTDWGATWTQATLPTAPYFIPIVGIGGESGTLNFWAATGTELYSTTDIGTTWKRNCYTCK